MEREGEGDGMREPKKVWGFVWRFLGDIRIDLTTIDDLLVQLNDIMEIII